MCALTLNQYIQDDYRYLLRLAQRSTRTSSVTLTATGLLHETYLRLHTAAPAGIRDQDHFRALVRRVMRHVIIDAVRQQQCQKRGGDVPHTSLSLLTLSSTVPSTGDETDAGLTEAMTALRQQYPQHAQLVEWRFFGGFSMLEITEMAGVSRRTTQRMWDTARHALHGYLTAA